jgi:hypothetical protein
MPPMWSDPRRLSQNRCKVGCGVDKCMGAWAKDRWIGCFKPHAKLSVGVLRCMVMWKKVGPRVGD